MKVKVKKSFSSDVNTVFSLWTDFEQKLKWMRLPDWIKLEKIIDESGKVIGEATSILKYGQWFTTKLENIYDVENVEIRCVVTEITDQQGNNLFDNQYTPYKAVACRSLFYQRNGGTDIVVEYHIEPKNIFRVLETLFVLHEFKKETLFLFSLLQDYISKQG
ncbi:MAG: hypothetical protein DRR16_15610 [Candidatus Parabeggiatoa sp. nov. 3]|jgi:hypothetical protein|nr:MAG: hypothetical protein DRR00_25415 [Gammaproteobacteria bacterium]RKZ54404.1 MAG: hypothetical protein DRQ99_31240 [Gammaproteobacteria bacterium]RKZ84113.1 MAG: hypothetical protein DRR16_15610 [Gammaproteobacteria bacterium]